MTALSIIFGFRDRDVTRVERCLTSLAQQTFTDFEVLFVDYGSQPPIAQAVQAIVEQHPFARYIYTETRGYAWNRSHALNIGGKVARGEYILTNDVDMIVPSTFVETLLKFAKPRRELHIAPYWLPQGFTDWENVESYAGKVEKIGQSGRGICLLATALFHEMRGYDEFYRYYGIEDRDMSTRLRLLGIEEYWLNDETAMFHQWHPPANYQVRDLMPEGVWSRMEIHFIKHRHEAIRNGNSWGQVYSSDLRPVFRFVDANQLTLHACPELHHINLPPMETQSIGLLRNSFLALESGHALAIHQANFPYPNQRADQVIKLLNRIFVRGMQGAKISYPTNTLHNFIANLVEPPAPDIADYYLNLPIQNGITVIVKA